jgi:hypothetical protein
MDLFDLRDRLHALDVETLLDKAVIENKEEILDLNRSQLDIGRDSLGNLLDRYVSDVYASFKQALGSKAPLGVPDLELEGDFKDGLVLLIEGDGYRITSTDEKTIDLENRYGSNIFGLTEESMEQIRPIILESFLKRLRDELL